MNYLAHSLLAGGEIDFVLGGMAGDFVKGRLDGVSDPGLRRGLALHTPLTQKERCPRSPLRYVLVFFFPPLKHEHCLGTLIMQPLLPSLGSNILLFAGVSLGVTTWSCREAI